MKNITNMMRVFLDLPLTEERLYTRGRLLITDSIP